MKDTYDIIIVGGGPAGSSAAMAAAQQGVAVLLLEKDALIGVPVRCAEGVSERSLHQLFETDAPWVSNRIKKLSFVAPDGTEVRVSSPAIGYLLDRAAFDQELARQAVEAGTEVWTRACVRGLARVERERWEVSVSRGGGVDRLRARVVIGADGVESRVGRWAGLHTATSLHDIETCVQYTMAGLEIDRECCQLHFGRQVAPGGYLWVFPKGPAVANVGVGISGEYGHTGKAVDYLDRFVGRRFPRASVLRAVGGSVPCSLPLKEPVADGLLLVGDAAHQADPLTGGGIMNAVRAGRLAGKVTAAAVASGDLSKKRLTVYQKQCEEAMGKKLRRSYRLKEAIFKLSDEELNATARALNRIDPEKRTLGRIFLTALAKNPKLLADVIALFGS
ncbi:MAG: geranylgeranyl reductase family protein [bacterium]